MPTYEFRCRQCDKGSRITYTYAEYDSATPTCLHCASEDVYRLISRVAMAKSEESRLESLADESVMSGLDGDDPRAVGKFMRKMGQESGEEMGDEFNEMVDRLEKGQSLEEVEKAIPDLPDPTSGVDFG